MIVVDASAVLEVLMRSQKAAAIEARMFDTGEALHAPHILDLEVAQVMRRQSKAGVTDSSRSREALADLIDLPLRRWPHLMFLPRIWELRNTLNAYDAAYIALAEALDAVLLTCDGRRARAPGHSARVEEV